MSYKDRKVKEKIVSKLRTICEVHREMYDIIVDSDMDKKEIRRLIQKLDEAYKMGKKMNNKLRQYKFNYDDGWWEENKNFKESLRKRKIK